jgi:hypothetical protein
MHSMYSTIALLQVCLCRSNIIQGGVTSATDLLNISIEHETHHGMDWNINDFVWAPWDLKDQPESGVSTSYSCDRN